MKKRNSSLESNIEWKTNDGGEIKVQDLIALAWIPLNLVEDIHDSEGKSIDAIAPNKLYDVGVKSPIMH